MELPSTVTRGVTLLQARNGLSNMATTATILTLVEKVSHRLNSDESTALNGSMAKETVNNIALKRIQQKLNITP